MKTSLKEIDAELSVGAAQVIWEKCFGKEICIKIPFDGKKCVSASGCVRILLENGVYKLEISLFGARKSFPLLNQCITGFTVGIASLKVCVSDLVVDGGRLKSVRIVARLCIGTKIGPINVEKCWDVIGTVLKLFTLEAYKSSSPDAQSTALTEAFETARLSASDYLYVEDDDLTEDQGESITP